jgi:hypothetical protein
MSRQSPKGTSQGYAILLNAAAAARRQPRPATGQSLVAKAERDELAYVAEGDPAMAEAIRAARATLPEFLTLAKYPKRGMEGFSVKVAIREGCEAEYFWIHPFEHAGKLFRPPQQHAACARQRQAGR